MRRYWIPFAPSEESPAPDFASGGSETIVPAIHLVRKSSRVMLGGQ